jgi:hypothetical protein
MKKIIMSVIGLAIALALVVAIWVPLATKSKGSALINYQRTNTIDTNVETMSSAVTTTLSTSSD